MAERMDRVKACFDREGPEAAAALGKSLNVSKQRMARWLATWGGDSAPRQQPAPKAGEPKRRSCFPHSPEATNTEPSAYMCMLTHYQAIAWWRRRNPGKCALPEHLDECEDELRAICVKNGWTYPGDIGVLQ